MDWMTQRLENHWLACMAAAGGGGRVTRLPGALVVVNPNVGGCALNFITLRSTSPDDLGQALEYGAALLAGEQRPPAVFVSPAAGSVEEIEQQLSRKRWRCTTRQAVLAMDLPAPDAGTESLHVQTIGPDQLDSWADTLVQGYEVSPHAAPDIRAAWAPLLQAPGEGCWSQFYLAWLEGSPVGTGLLWSQGEIAGLYCGAVIPTARRRGIERATVLRRLAEASSRGALVATLQTEAGSPVEHLCVHRLGFRVAHYRSLWVPATKL